MYRVCGNAVEVAVTGSNASAISGTLTLGTLPAAYRPKQQANIICNVHSLGAKVFLQTMTDGKVNVLVSDGSLPSGSSVYCARTFLV